MILRNQSILLPFYSQDNNHSLETQELCYAQKVTSQVFTIHCTQRLMYLSHAPVAGHDDLCGVLHGAALLQPAQPHQADHGETGHCRYLNTDMYAMFNHVQ